MLPKPCKKESRLFREAAARFGDASLAQDSRKQFVNFSATGLCVPFTFCVLLCIHTCSCWGSPATPFSCSISSHLHTSASFQALMRISLSDRTKKPLCGVCGFELQFTSNHNPASVVRNNGNDVHATEVHTTMLYNQILPVKRTC